MLEGHCKRVVNFAFSMAMALALSAWTLYSFAAPSEHHSEIGHPVGERQVAHRRTTLLPRVIAVPSRHVEGLQLQTSMSTPLGGEVSVIPRSTPTIFSQENVKRCTLMTWNHDRVRPLEDYSRLQPAPDPSVVRQRTGVVRLSCRGQWGNRIGEYVFARLVAENLGFGLIDVTGGNMLLDDNWKKGHLFPGMSELPYNVVANKALQPATKSKGHSPNFTELVSNREPRTLHLAGYPFNDMSLFWENRKSIRERILAIDVACVYWNITSWPRPQDVVIHLRAYGGKCVDPKPKFDVKGQFVNPPFEYYDRILKRMKSKGSVGTIWLAARCRENDPVAVQLVLKHGARFVPDTGVRQDVTEWLWLVSAKRVVIAQSTFSWWAAFLGTASEVHFPLVGEWWGNRPRFRLYPNDKRYIYHDMVNEKWFMTYKHVANTELKDTW